MANLIVSKDENIKFYYILLTLKKLKTCSPLIQKLFFFSPKKVHSFTRLNDLPQMKTKQTQLIYDQKC